MIIYVFYTLSQVSSANNGTIIDQMIVTVSLERERERYKIDGETQSKKVVHFRFPPVVTLDQ